MEAEAKKAQAFSKGYGYHPRPNNSNHALSNPRVLGSNHYASGHISDLIGQSTSFNPREVGEVVERFGVSQEVLPNMPMAECPGALATILLPYQRQGLAWMSDKESPKHPRSVLKTLCSSGKGSVRLTWTLPPIMPPLIRLLFLVEVFWLTTWDLGKPFKLYL